MYTPPIWKTRVSPRFLEPNLQTNLNPCSPAAEARHARGPSYSPGFGALSNTSKQAVEVAHIDQGSKAIGDHKQTLVLLFER